MKKYLVLVLLVGIFACADTLTVKEGDIYLGTSKLTEAEYYHYRNFVSASEYWVLKFENGMVIRLDLRMEKHKPGVFLVGQLYEIYTDGTWHKAKKVKEK